MNGFSVAVRSLNLFCFHVDVLFDLVESGGLEVTVARDMSGDLKFLTIGIRINTGVDASGGAAQLDVQSPPRKIAAKASPQPKSERRRVKYAAKTMKAAPAITHHSAGRHRYAPAVIPREYARVAHSMGWRGAFRWKVGGDAAGGD
jgi:hypothetical protein